MSRNYQLSENGKNLIKQFEGCRLSSYYDSVGVLTIGYGWTNFVDGQRIYEGMTITQEKANELFDSGVIAYVNGVNDVLNVDLTQNQFDACVSLCYNIGISGYQNSGLVKKLNDGDIQGASNDFLLWNKGTVNGKLVEIQGLTNRRRKEKELFDKPGEQIGTPVYANSLEDMANRVQSGDFGNGTDRVENLGKYYNGVQTIVNHRYNPSDEVTINNTLLVLLRETLNGVYGDGQERKNLLGSYYEPVQGMINKGIE